MTWSSDATQDADIRIVDPRISRAHLILRFEQGKWLAIDNGSVNGTFVNGYRRPVIDIHDGQSINIGNAGGPRLSFEVGQQRRKAGRRPGAGSQRPLSRPPPMVDASPARTAPVRTHRARPAARDAGQAQGRPSRPRRDSLQLAADRADAASSRPARDHPTDVHVPAPTGQPSPPSAEINGGQRRFGATAGRGVAHRDDRRQRGLWRRIQSCDAGL